MNKEYINSIQARIKDLESLVDEVSDDIDILESMLDKKKNQIRNLKLTLINLRWDIKENE